MNIYFYRNIARYSDLRSYLARRSVKYEVNMMSRRRDRIFLIIDIGTLPVLVLIVFAIGLVAFFWRYPQFDPRVLLTGLVGGMLFVLSSVTVWMLLNDTTQTAREYAHIMTTLMSLTVMVPLVLACRPVLRKPGSYFVAFLATYVLGYLVGWGGMSAFFPNREHRLRTGESGGQQG